MSCNCNRIAVQVLQIFDGARVEQHIDRTLALTNFVPATVVPPLTYTSASFSGIATITSQTITRLNDGRYRINLIYSFPVTVNYVNANGVRGTAQSTITDGVDIILHLPGRPYYIEVEADFRSRIGEIDGSIAEIRGCLLTIVKVLVRRDVIIEACDVTYPIATETQDVVCRELFDD